MEWTSFVFTIFFMLLGPLKVIPGFLKATRGADLPFQREVAVKAALLASAIVALVALAGTGMLAKYSISLDAVRIAGGLVLLISALKIMFPSAEPPAAEGPRPTALQLAISPIAVPIIVPPAGIAAILIFTVLAPEYPGMQRAIAVGLLAIMVLDFLAMFFVDSIVRIPGLMLVLQVLGAVLVFIQVALAIETIVTGIEGLGLRE